MRILFLAKDPHRPSFRFRVEQLLPAFRARGHVCEVRFLPKGALRRAPLLLGARGYDVAFVQKNLFPRPLLALLRAAARTLVYDIDDAIMFGRFGQDVASRSTRFAAMARTADLVVCGNSFLADQTARLGGKTAIVPTGIDTERFHPREREKLARGEGGRVVVGWTGSNTNNYFLSALFPVLARLAGKIELRILSSTERGLEYQALGAVPHRFTHWTPENEVCEVAGYDVGLMPLADTPWTRGKCAFKALQYMALGIPTVASPVGVNCELIEDGRTGFLPKDDDAWHVALARLVASPQLRAELGAAGRARVVATHSLDVIGPLLVDAVEQAARRR